MTTSSPAAARCFNHPDRPALAICVACGKAVCQSCSTRWEGMHHCVSCLAARRDAVRERGARVRSLAMALIALALLAGATFLRAIVGAVLAGAF